VVKPHQFERFEFDEVLLDVEIAMQLLFSFDQISNTVMQALAGPRL
jgi:hypothetical protein